MGESRTHTHTHTEDKKWYEKNSPCVRQNDKLDSSLTPPPPHPQLHPQSPGKTTYNPVNRQKQTFESQISRRDTLHFRAIPPKREPKPQTAALHPMAITDKGQDMHITKIAKRPSLTISDMSQDEIGYTLRQPLC